MSAALPFEWFGRMAIGATREAGGVAVIAARTFRGLRRLDRRELARATVQFGWDSLPLGLAVALFTGAILVLLANVNVQRYGARAILGWAAGYSVLREFGPLLTAMVMTGRVGARNAAELATMTVGGQLEGLRGVGVDPFELLVAPRLAASAIAIAAVGLAANLVAVLAAALFAQGMLDVELGTFFRSFAELLGWRDLAAAFCKMVAFGVAIALVSTRCGLGAQGGARAVGRAAALSVVASSAVLTALDWALTLLLARVLG